jgi:hypothetical protein
MKLAWHKQQAGIYTAMIGDRDFRITKTRLGWEVWYSRNSGKETLVGIADTLALAKEAGDDTIDTILAARRSQVTLSQRRRQEDSS